MANTITYPPIIMDALDALYVQDATSGWMQNNASQVKYVGGKEIRVPLRKMTGLGDYNRPDGKYAKGSIETKYQTRELTQDRSAEFYFDRNDVDESGYLVEAIAVMSQFTKEHVIPELDAYRYSKIAASAVAESQSETYTPGKSDIISKILTNLNKIQNDTGMSLSNFVITMPYTVYGVLELSDELSRSLTPQNFTQGSLNFEVKSLNGVPIIPVTSDRMKTAYEFATGETDFGFTPAAAAKDINWLITPRSTPIAITKTNNLKIFNPDENQDGDGWKTQYRIYHDLFVLDNKVKAIFASIGA